MNEIVIDASCIFEFLFNQADKESVVKTVGMSQLVAPNCLPFEIGNAVSKMIKRKFITVFDGVAVFHEFAKIPMRLMEPDIPSAIVIAGETESYAYDAYYISLAKQLSLPLFTMDVTMKNNAVSRGVSCL